MEIFNYLLRLTCKSIRRIASMTLCTLLLLFMSGCYLFPEEEKILDPPLIKTSKITYEVMTVEKGDLEKIIVDRGTFVSIKQNDLFFKERGGRVKSVAVKMGDEVKKGDVLLELETGDLEKQIKKQELYYRKAQITYKQMKENGANKYDMEKMAIDLEISKMDLDSLLEQREKAKLVADIDGNVVYVEKLKEGDYVDVFKTLIRIADPSNIQLEYTGEQAEQYKVGMEVQVKYASDIYSGTVIMTPDSVPEDGDESLKKSVRIKVDNLKDTVRVGAIANITLLLDSRQDVVVLPKALVREYSGRNYVYVLENDLKAERDVELGLETATQVEIIKGLKEGEQVITR